MPLERHGYSLVLLGAPHSGKSAVSRILTDQFDFYSFNFGSYLRELVEQRCSEPFMTEVNQVIKNGGVLSDDLATKLFIENVNVNKHQNFLTDGYPRTVGTVNEFRDFLRVNDRDERRTYVVHLEVDLDSVPKLLSERGREDDKDPRAIAGRIETYRRTVVPTITKLSQSFDVICLKYDDGLKSNIDKIVKTIDDSHAS